MHQSQLLLREPYKHSLYELRVPSKVRSMLLISPILRDLVRKYGKDHKESAAFDGVSGAGGPRPQQSSRAAAAPPPPTLRGPSTANPADSNGPSSSDSGQHAGSATAMVLVPQQRLTDSAGNAGEAAGSEGKADASGEGKGGSKTGTGGN